MASAIPGMISGGKERIAEILRIIYIYILLPYLLLP